MGTDALGYVLCLASIGMSMIATRYRNMLLTLGASTLWATFLAFILANTTAGTNWLTMFILAAGTFILAFMLLSVFSRRGTSRSLKSDIMSLSSTEKEERLPSKRKGGIMDLPPEDYRAYIRASMRMRRRR